MSMHDASAKALIERRAQSDRRARGAHNRSRVRPPIQGVDPVEAGAVACIVEVDTPWTSQPLEICVPAGMSFADLGIRRDTTSGLFEFNPESLKRVLTLSRLLKITDQKPAFTVEMIYAVVRALFETADARKEAIPSEQAEFVLAMETPRFAMLTVGQASNVH